MKKIILLLCLISSLSLSAKTVIVSDIDDTIKIAGVKAGIGKMIKYAFNTKVYFKGMPEVLNELVKLDNDTKVIYLSNAKKWLMNKFHNKLLRKGNFPVDQVILRKKLSSKEHKLIKLREIIKENNPDTMILIGDNGQDDAAFYDQISKEYKNIVFHQFIRLVYSGKKFTDKILNNQTMFVSPIEIAAYFKLLNNDNRFDAIIENTVNFLSEKNKTTLLLRKYSKGPKYFPKWLDCSGYSWPFGDKLKDDKSVHSYLKYLQVKCR